MLDPFVEAWELREMVIARQIRPREVAQFFLDRVQRLNPGLGAFITISAERAYADADALEKLSPDELRKYPLAGVPYSIKDLNWTRDIRTTFGSRNYENHIPTQDSEVARRLRAAGGIMLGKTATPEFGGRPTTEGGLCPPARNPWNPAHTAGGSSGGAAAAVASGMNPIAHGTDGGGSIRIPAACCGIVGLKPARGRISHAPAKGESWHGYSTSGPMGRSVRDVALMLDVMAGPVVGDPYWAPPPPRPFSDAVRMRPKGLRLAAISHSALGAVDDEVRAAFDSACLAFRDMGHRVEPIDLDPGPLLLKVSGTIMSAGLGANRIENPDLMDPLVRGSWRAGRKVSAVDYISAVEQMHNTAREIVQQLAFYDALLTPTLTRPAVPLGSLPAPGGNAMKEIYAWIAFTFAFNATGQPAFSLPNGFSAAGLPIGLQMVGRQADEFSIIQLAAQFEEARPWKERRPPLD